MSVGQSITLEELERDPYPVYARLRDDEPVLWVPGRPALARDAIRRRPLRRSDARGVHGGDRPIDAQPDDGREHAGHGGAEQQRIRRVVEPPFPPRDVEERTQGMIPKLAHELIDGFRERGSCDLFTEFADPMSVQALRFMLGLDEVRWQDILRWNQGLEREPDGSVLSWMLRRDGDDAMTREEIVANTKLMLSGGLHEQRDLIALTVYALGTHPEQLDEVRAEPALVKRAVEETLRWAVGTSTRQTTGATELASVGLPEGALIGAVLSSANRDPRRFDDPDRFDVRRKDGAHVAFAAGSHFCLGAWFGRHLARVSLEILLDRLPNLRLDPDRPVTLRGWEFRAPDTTWVRWDA
jgi:cytochrome P450